MNRYGLFLCRPYAGLLNFYPWLFRKDFASEMQTIFDQGMLPACLITVIVTSAYWP